jgi:hypothetical protein
MNIHPVISLLSLQLLNKITIDEKHQEEKERVTTDIYHRVVHQAKTSTDRVFKFDISTIGYDRDFIALWKGPIMGRLQMQFPGTNVSFKDDIITVDWS